MRWPKYWSFSFSIITSKEIPGLISYRMDWLDVKLKTDVTFMRGLQSRVRMLPARCEDAALKAELERFAEQVQYSDPVSSEAILDAEANLSAAVDTLQQALVDGDIPAALQQVKQCEIALAERNRLCKVSKHG